MTALHWLLLFSSTQGGNGSLTGTVTLSPRDPSVVFIWDVNSIENGKTAASIGKLDHFKQYAATKEITKDGSWIAHHLDDYCYYVDSTLIRAGFHQELAKFPWPKSTADIKAFRLSDLNPSAARTMQAMATASPWGSEFNSVMHANDPGMYYELRGSVSQDGKLWGPSKKFVGPDPGDILKLAPGPEAIAQARESIVSTSVPTQTMIQASADLGQPSMRGFLNLKAAEIVLKLREEQLALERAEIANAISGAFGKLNDGSILDENRSIQLKDLPPAMQEQLLKAYGPAGTSGRFHLRLRLFIGFPTSSGNRGFAAGMIR